MGTPDYGGMAAGQEKKRQSLIKEGTVGVNKAFSGFDQGFYDQRAKAYQNMAMPQLSDQYRATRNAELFGMANRGLLGGSASQQSFSGLNRKMAQNQQQIADTGISQGQDLERQIQDKKTNLLNMVYSGADPANAISQATSTAAGFRPNSLYAPISNMFGDIANQYYMNQMMNQYRQSNMMGNTVPSYIGGSPLPSISTSTGYKQ